MKDTRLQLVLVGSCILSAFVGFIGGGLVGRATASSCDVCPPQRSVLMHTVGENAATATGKLEVVCNVEILSTVRDSELAVCNYDATKSTKTRYNDGMTTVSTDCAVAECIEDKFVEDSRRRRRLADGSRCQDRTMKFKCPNVNYKGTSENYESSGFNKQVSCSNSLAQLKPGGRGSIDYFTQVGFQGKKTAGASDLPQKTGQKGFVHCEYQDLQGVLHDLPILYWENPRFSFFAGVSNEGYSVVYRQLFGIDNVTTIGNEPVPWESKGLSGQARPDWITIIQGQAQSSAAPEAMQDLRFYVDRSAYAEPEQNDVMVEFMLDGTNERRLACCPPIKAGSASFDALWEGRVPRTSEEALERFVQAQDNPEHAITKLFATLRTAARY